MKNRVCDLFDLSKPVIMGILNITPDSFSERGRFLSKEDALQYALQMEHEGADIIDIGSEATNPKTKDHLSSQSELDRLLPVLELLRQETDLPISVDTSDPDVMIASVNAGANLINDVRALRSPKALTTVADLKVPVCLMHMTDPWGINPFETAASQPPQGEHQSKLLQKPDIVTQVKEFLLTRVNDCLAAGITREQIIIDPGFGTGKFGKNLRQHLQLLYHLEKFTEWNLPILVGVSRKTFIGDLLQLDVAERLPASLAAAVIAVMNGANIIRTHDVKATREAVMLADAVQNLKEIDND